MISSIAAIRSNSLMADYPGLTPPLGGGGAGAGVGAGAGAGFGFGDGAGFCPRPGALLPLSPLELGVYEDELQE